MRWGIRSLGLEETRPVGEAGRLWWAMIGMGCEDVLKDLHTINSITEKESLSVSLHLPL